MITKNEKLFDQLENQRKQLFQLLSGYNADQLHQAEKQGAWSVIQVINHLLASEKGTELYIRKKTQKPELIPNTSLIAPIKILALRGAFSMRLKFKAPKQLGVVSNEDTLEDLEALWNKSRSSFHQLMEELPVEIQQKALFRHPIVGRINMNQTLEFFDFHYRHHLKQIHRILKTVA